MSRRRDRRERDGDPANIGVAHGEWGEGVACDYLRVMGYQILERNCRPCSWDRRYEIDIVAYDRQRDVLVFVEVKQHRARSPYQRRLRSICRHKKQVLLTACRAWLRRNRWQSGYRFDVVEVYGEPESRGHVEVDHVERVQLFENDARFVNWVA